MVFAAMAFHAFLGVALLLFGGRGKISGIMGDTAKGIRAFREGLKGEDAPEDALRECAAEAGMVSLRESALQKLAEGVTTALEVLRVGTDS